MEYVKFENLEELKSFLDSGKYFETKYMVGPDFVPAIIGISFDGRLVYSYDLMSEWLAGEYENDKSYESDNYTLSAMDYIDYNITNVGTGSPIILNKSPLDGFDSIYDTDCIDEALEPYSEAVMGLSENDEIILDRNKLSHDDFERISSALEGLEEVVTVLFA